MTVDVASLSAAELAALDALLAPAEDDKWAGFYAARDKPCPFFTEAPDENLLRWLAAGLLPPGRALDLGCGHGRNALCLARHGYAVQAVDASPSAVAWARERIAASGLPVALHQQSVLDFAPSGEGADLVYDSGCFHHIAPHRRRQYVEQVARLLKPGGAFGLVCFRPEAGSGFSDDEVYRRRSLGGGLGYSEAELRALWSPALRLESIEPMREMPAGADSFGRAFLWVCLARKC